MAVEPLEARPIANPAMPCSHSGVLKTYRHLEDETIRDGNGKIETKTQVREMRGDEGDEGEVKGQGTRDERQCDRWTIVALSLLASP